MDKKSFNNPFRRKDGNQQGMSKKESEWGKVKFNPVSRAALTEQATPWSHFKNDLIKQQDELRINDNPNSQEILRKREENYRRNLITSKRNEPTQWEDFSEATAPESSSKTKDKQKGRFHQIPSNIKNIDSIKKEDFDSRLLTKNQNNFLKKIITRNVCTVKGGSLKSAVKDLKFNGVVIKNSNEIKSMQKRKKK